MSLETEFGSRIKTKIRMPIMTGALGSTFIAEKYWDSFAIGGALIGIPVVIGENVVGVDKNSEIGPQTDKKGKNVVDMSFAGGFALEDHIFKALALGAPYTKLICMGRAIMIPGFLGSNIEGAIHPDRRSRVNGNWNELPKTVLEVGKTVDEIFAGYHDFEKKNGKDEIKNIPYGAIGFYTQADKLGCGLQQLMAGTRKFSLDKITRHEFLSFFENNVNKKVHMVCGKFSYIRFSTEKLKTLVIKWLGDKDLNLN